MSKSELVKVVFQPDGAEVFVPAGILLSKALAASGRAIETPCGGVGTCRKCRVIVSGAVDDPTPIEAKWITDEDLSAGVRLACKTKVKGEISITIPESSRPLIQKILSAGTLRDFALASGVSKVYCELPKPSLDDETAAFERIAAYLEALGIYIHPNLNNVRALSAQLKEYDYKVTAVICSNQLIAVEPGDTTSICYGIAYDLGSTTVVGYLMDLITGDQLGVAAVMNPQVVYGDDLMTRISFSTTEKNGLSILQISAVDAFNRIAESLVDQIDGSLDQVYKVTVVGNTCMSHILLGIDVASLGQSPYAPSLCRDVTVSAENLGLRISPEAHVTVLPNIAGFVGADTVGVMLAADWNDDGRTRLAVDIGTNGEMALMHKGKTFVCSAAAGPAFEGAGIGCGMRGAPGAIDSVIIGDSVKITTIENRPPIGLCGSGLVDAVAQMLDAGIVDDSGRLLSPSEATHLPETVRSRLVDTGTHVEFMLASERESGMDKPIVLTAADIRHLQLAKGSIHAAIQTLLQIAGTSDCELDEILLAGAFGNYISVESAIRIGLLPSIDKDKVLSIGNAAGAGARLALLSVQEMEAARMLAASADHIELAVSPVYQMELMERMMFPEPIVQIVADKV